jgi:hypothetical protein
MAYEVLPNEQRGFRIVDESGKENLYPADRFKPGRIAFTRGSPIQAWGCALLVVVGFFLLLFISDLGGLLRSREAANEASATATLRTLNKAETAYASTYKSGFTEGLNPLGPPDRGRPYRDRAGLVELQLSGRDGGTNTSFVKNGYEFKYHAGARGVEGITTYSITADPTTRGSSGQRSFFTDQSAVIRANATAPATATDDPF